ncbi:MAG TPA: ATP-binding cassette domain-containing protein [Candidatus Saccharimonadales bacterium]|nr:ATP-binding cassette domain-containing protein [Candidatus Saccharimonadales bacterium]
MAKPVVYTKNLKKYFPSRRGTVKAVDGVNLSVPAGQIFGFLGPNGAGKTTTLRILTTLIEADSGEATVAGLDVLKEPDNVRLHIGYVSQSGGSDRPATGMENLMLQGRLYGMTHKEAKERAIELVKLLDLTDFADRVVYTYSGGQRRRLDVALGIMHSPEVLFLDEPTTGLDPQNRSNLWTQIKKLKEIGTTIFLTTHYLEEADMLSDYLVIMDQGKIVAEGTPRELKRQIASDTVNISVNDPTKNNPKLITLFKEQKLAHTVIEEGGNLKLSVKNGDHALPEILRLLEKEKITLKTATLTVPTLDDVFLNKTGRSLRDTAAEGEAK